MKRRLDALPEQFTAAQAALERGALFPALADLDLWLAVGLVKRDGRAFVKVAAPAPFEPGTVVEVGAYTLGRLYALASRPRSACPFRFDTEAGEDFAEGYDSEEEAVLDALDGRVCEEEEEEGPPVTALPALRGPWAWRDLGRGMMLTTAHSGALVVMAAQEVDGQHVLAVRDERGVVVPVTPEHPVARLLKAAPALYDVLAQVVAEARACGAVRHTTASAAEAVMEAVRGPLSVEV